MKNLVKNIIKKITLDYQSSGKGNILFQNLALKHEGRTMTFKTIALNWDFTKCQVNITKGALTGKGKGTITLKIEGMAYISPAVQGEFSLGHFEANSLEDLQNLMLVLPAEVVAMGRAIQ